LPVHAQCNGADTVAGLARAKLVDLQTFAMEHNYIEKIGRGKVVVS
jgi:hypothetical protein